MEILAVGVRYNRSNPSDALVHVITGENSGDASHINTHKLDAAKWGQGWLNIEAAIYKQFRNSDDLIAYVEQIMAAMEPK